MTLASSPDDGIPSPTAQLREDSSRSPGTPIVDVLSRSRRGRWRSFRSVLGSHVIVGTLLAFLLFTTFLLLLATVAVRYWYETFVARAVHDLARTYDFAAVRRTDATYYQRPCSASDVLLLGRDTTAKLSDNAYHDLTVPDDGTIESIADHMMSKGVGMFHRLASVNATQALRQYILDKNQKVTAFETIEVPPTAHRIAYALDPVEHVAVEHFLHQLTSHALLKATIQYLTGDDDPAITELAVITSYAGARPQRWHHDVISERGSAVQFGRTYTHTYSLFVALQDTDASMGGTKVCPGTHYCGVTQDHVCQTHGFTPPHWHAASGVLFNQQLAHAGGGHQTNQTMKRVMFVISFTRRPDWHYDGRVFASGLYCFSQWTTWGLTWQDLSLSTPHWHTRSPILRTLKSLGVWKPHRRNWGMDYITKQILEWNLAENGMELFRLTQTAQWLQQHMYLPAFLHGEIVIVSDEMDFPDKLMFDIYHLYFRTTMRNVGQFALGVHTVLLGAALMWWASRAQDETPPWQQRRLYRRVGQGAVLIYILPTVLVVYTLWSIRRSCWGRNILTGRLYREPFAVIPPGDENGDAFSSSSKLLPYPTTVPERTDVLIGTRLKAAHLGSMQVWLDYHPGNVLFRRTILPLEPYANVLPHAILYHELVRSEFYGRLLLQDWRTGNWLELDEAARFAFVDEELQKLGDPLLAALIDAIDERMAFYRFDVSYRSSALALVTQSMLANLRDALLFHTNARPKTIASSVPKDAKTSCFVAQTLSNVVQQRWDRNSTTAAPMASATTTGQRHRAPLFHIGETVVAIEDEGPSRATILAIRFEDSNGNRDDEDNGEYVYDLAYERGDEEVGAYEYELFAVEPLVSGMYIDCRLVDGNVALDNNETVGDIDDLLWTPVLVRTVRPDGYIDGQYFDDDGGGHWVMDVNSDEACLWTDSKERA
jgi:hypothetical protein